MRPPAAAAAVLSLPLAAHAWGELGHATIAYVAQNYLTPSAASWAQSVLGSTSSSSYLASIASWADDFRYEAGNAWSAPLHFLDAQDDAPSDCNVDYSRDCTSAGCVVSAMANYTGRVTDSRVSKTQRGYALRFIVHFVGDSHQPLHNEYYALGGNDIDVTFNGDDGLVLHGIWDTQILEQSRGVTDYSASAAESWAAELVRAIDSGAYKSQKAAWSTVDVTDPIGQVTGWSSEANAYVCSTVVPNGWDAVTTGDLATNGYYDGVVGVVEEQLAKAGVRLAAWINALAASASSKRGLEDSVPLGTHFLPEPRALTPAQKIRRAAGADCGCSRH